MGVASVAGLDPTPTHPAILNPARRIKRAAIVLWGGAGSGGTGRIFVGEPPEGHRALSRAHLCAEILKDPL